MAIKHKFSSSKADGADSTLVRPSNWNDDHNHVPFVYTLYARGTGLTFLDIPAAVTEQDTRFRTKADLTYALQTRIVTRVTTAANASAEVRGQYSTDEAAWSYLDGVDGPKVTIDTTGVRAGAWVNLASAAKADVFLRWVTVNGDGLADPVIPNMHLQFR